MTVDAESERGATDGSKRPQVERAAASTSATGLPRPSSRPEGGALKAREPPGVTPKAAAPATEEVEGTKKKRKRKRGHAVAEWLRTLLSFVAAPASGSFRAATDAAAMCCSPHIIEKRSKYLAPVLTELRGQHVNECVGVMAVPNRNGAALVYDSMEARQRKDQPVGVAVCCCVGGPLPGGEPRLAGAISAAVDIVARANWQAALSGLVRALYYSNLTQCTDPRRGNVRWPSGYPEMCCSTHKDYAGVPQEPASSGGMWYMRVAPQHALPGSTQLLDVLLPVMSAGLRVVAELPGCKEGLGRLQAAVGCFAYPHLPKLMDIDGRPVLRPSNKEHGLACCSMHRASIILAAGARARQMIHGLVPDLGATAKIDGAINDHKRCVMHEDLRDLGLGSELLGKEMALKANIEIVNGCPDGVELLQFVHVFSFGVTEFEALSAVGLDESQLTFTMAGPHVANNEGVRYMIYGMDFSARLHGNPSLGSSELLPSDAWAIGVTAYATTHGATWARRVAGMEGKEAREFLSSCMGFPGSGELGSESAQGRRARRAEEHVGAGLVLRSAPAAPAVGERVRVLSVEGEWQHGLFLVEAEKGGEGWVDWDGGTGTAWWRDVEAAGLEWEVVSRSKRTRGASGVRATAGPV